VKKEVMAEGRKASRASKTTPPSPLLKVWICHCVIWETGNKIKHNKLPVTAKPTRIMPK